MTATGTPFLLFPGTGANLFAQRAAGPATSLHLLPAARSAGLCPTAPAPAPTPQGQQPVGVLRPPAATPVVPWHFSRVPLSFNQWTDEGGEVWTKALASVHTAYISHLLDGNHPREQRLARGKDQQSCPGFPCLCMPRAHSTAILGRHDSVYLIRWRISLHPPESALVTLAGSGPSTRASWPSLPRSLFLCIPEALGQRSVEERIKRLFFIIFKWLFLF